LKEIVRFIALNNPQNARRFKSELIDKIKKLPHMPYKYRKSIYFDNEDIRDMIFKGYITVYKINQNQIVIVGISKYKDGI
jgi:plasmid stabilization system protein ParE